MRVQASFALAAALAAAVSPVNAFTVNISTGSRMIYLQVGDGSFTGTLQGGGSPGANLTTANRVFVDVPVAQVGTGTPQPMDTNSAAAISYWDGFRFCNPSTELYVGGFYRRPNNNTADPATLRANAPSTLNNGTRTIQITEISWTSRGNASGGGSEPGPQPFPDGNFVAGSQTIGTIQRNQWAESCHTFSYANSTVVPAGVYTGTVVYTLTAPP